MDQKVLWEKCSSQIPVCAQRVLYLFLLAEHIHSSRGVWTGGIEEVVMQRNKAKKLCLCFSRYINSL